MTSGGGAAGGRSNGGVGGGAGAGAGGAVGMPMFYGGGVGGHALGGGVGGLLGGAPGAGGGGGARPSVDVVLLGPALGHGDPRHAPRALLPPVREPYGAGELRRPSSRSRGLDAFKVT